MQKPDMLGILEYSEPFHNCIPTHEQKFTNIQNSGIFKTWHIFTGPNAGCKAHADYFTVLIYITTRITAKCGIFTHLTSTNLHWLSKASTHYYMDTIYRLPAAFYEYFIKVVIVSHLSTATWKILLYYHLIQNPLKDLRLSFSAKIVKNYNCFSKVLHRRFLIRFRIPLSLNK